jgi:hypothetical protein
LKLFQRIKIMYLSKHLEKMKTYGFHIFDMGHQLFQEDMCKQACDWAQCKWQMNCRDCLWCMGLHSFYQYMPEHMSTHHQKNNQLQLEQLQKKNLRQSCINCREK